jgi:hypothetical protein
LLLLESGEQARITATKTNIYKPDLLEGSKGSLLLQEL